MARQPVLATPRGDVRPSCCRTDELWGEPSGPRLDEKHGSVRFSDNARGGWKVFLNGEDVTSDCREYYAGDVGWVILYDRNQLGNRYECPFGRLESNRHALRYKKYGTVQVVRSPIRPV